MKEVKRIFVAVLMAVILSLGTGVSMTAFGQKNNNSNNRPPRDPEKVRQPDNKPRGNTNSQRNSNRQGRD